jgi:hypothetical protein
MDATEYDIERRDQRVRVEHDVRVLFSRKRPGGEEIMVSGRIINQSSGGFCIQTSSYIREGDLLKALISLNEETECYLHVRWVRQESAGIIFGCNFVDLTIDRDVVREALCSLSASGQDLSASPLPG